MARSEPHQTRIPLNLLREAGAVLFAGKGGWLEPTVPGEHGDDALLLAAPCRILTAESPEQVQPLLKEIDLEQKCGRYVCGFLTYEAGAAFGFTVHPPADETPLGWMAVYDPEAVVRIPAHEWESLLAQVDTTTVSGALAAAQPSLSVPPEEYSRAINRVRDYIAAGDTYQVNYTVRGWFELGPEDAIDPLTYFLALLVRQNVPYAAFFNLGDVQVVSLSPELFLRRRGRRLESRPMKGTRPRGKTHPEDVALAYELAQSEKERAENLMIVDMVRNDLGKVCRPGSVRVPALYVVEPYRTVWQMTSAVVGETSSQVDLADIMAAVFPGASITGAPKHHTMEIIAELETEPRGTYTGTIGLFFPGGDFTANIAIRTILYRQGRCKLGTGSGVVWDAVAAPEYEETLAKTAFVTPPADEPWRPDPASLPCAAGSATTGTTGRPRSGKQSPPPELQLFETILLQARNDACRPAIPSDMQSEARSDPLSRYLFLAEHLARLAASAGVLGLEFSRDEALALLRAQALQTGGSLVVRLALDTRAQLTVSARPAPPIPSPDQPVALLVSPFRTDPDDPLLRHKTSRRSFYDREYRRASQAGFFDALFLNRLDRVTEGAITNLFARFGNHWVTPPLTDGLLPGIWRAHFLARTRASEASLTLEDLLAADEVVVGNSVRGSFRVNRLRADPLTF